MFEFLIYILVFIGLVLAMLLIWSFFTSRASQEEQEVIYDVVEPRITRARSRRYSGKKYRIRSKSIQNPVSLQTAVEVLRRREKIRPDVFVLVTYFMPTKSGFYMSYEEPNKYIAIDELGLYDSKGNYGYVKLPVTIDRSKRVTVTAIANDYTPIPEPRPKRETYGWIDPNPAIGEQGGWCIEGGEEAYNEAVEKWAIRN